MFVLGVGVAVYVPPTLAQNWPSLGVEVGAGTWMPQTLAQNHANLDAGGAGEVSGHWVREGGDVEASRFHAY